MNPLDPMDFDALQYTNQSFNTLDKLASSQSIQNMTQQTLNAIQTMQTPTVQGYVPGYVTIPSSQAPKNTKQFFLAIGNEQRGPFSLSEVEGLLSMGQITYQTLAWTAGMNEWSTLQMCLQFVQP